MDRARTRDIYDGSITRLFFRFSIPAVFSLFTFGLYQFIDAVFVGQWIGPEALGAVGLVYPVSLINNGLFLMVGTGAASLLSRAIGGENEKVIDAIFGNMLLLNMAGSALITFFGIRFAVEIVGFMGGEGVILDYGVRYLRVLFIGSFFFNFASSGNMLIRAEGKMRQAMGIAVIGPVLNLLLDPLFILVFGLGVEGAAAATVVSQFVTAAACFVYLLRGSCVMKVSRSAPGLTNHVKEIIKVGLSGLALPGMTIIQMIALLRSVVYYGSQNDIIIIGAIIKIVNLIFVPIWGICHAFQPIAGINYGAGYYERVKKSFFLFSLYATITVAFIWILIQLFPQTILSWFITDSALVEYGVWAYRLYLCDYPVYGYMLLVITLFQAIGKGGSAAFLVVSRMSIFFFPAVFFLPKLIGLDGVYLATPASDAVVLVIGTVMIIRELRRQSRL